MKTRSEFEAPLSGYVNTRMSGIRVEFEERDAIYCGNVIGQRNGEDFFHVTILLTARSTVGCWTREDFDRGLQQREVEFPIKFDAPSFYPYLDKVFESDAVLESITGP